MSLVGIDRDVARKSASHKFGHVFFWWYAAPVVAGKVVKVLLVPAACVVLLLGARYVASHAGSWAHVANNLFTVYLLPSLLVAFGVALYAIGALVAWRMWGWLWSFKGLSAKRYTFVMSSVMVIFIAILGVSL